MTSELVGVKLHILNELLKVLQLIVVYLQEAFEIVCCGLTVFLARLAHFFVQNNDLLVGGSALGVPYGGQHSVALHCTSAQQLKLTLSHNDCIGHLLLLRLHRLLSLRRASNCLLRSCLLILNFVL